ncbi:MAG: TRAP transporter small permease, partial [Pseudogulbenkiania sp.]|nr:TRAP transporter small permease [Pseudogulbenkiania sp.]
MEQLTRGIKRLIGLAMVGAMLVMVILVFTNVVLRYGFGSGIAASEEIVRHLFVWVTFLGAILGVIEGTHIGVDSLINALPETGRKICS